MDATFATLFTQLSHASEEFQVILDPQLEVVFANKLAQSKLGLELGKIASSKMGLTDSDFLGLKEKPYTKASVGLAYRVHWKLEQHGGNFLLVGKDMGNAGQSEEEKFSRALKEITLSPELGNYSGRLTDMQNVLANEVDKFKLISENVSDIVCLHEPHEARYLYVSPACKEVTGYQPHEMEGRSPYDFFHPEMIAALQEDHRRREAGEIPADAPTGPPPKMIYLFKTKERGFRWMESHSRPIFDHNGQVILILSTSRDVHEREEAEKEKQRFLGYYKTLGNNIPNGAVFMIDSNFNYLIAEGEEFGKLGRTSDYYVGKNARDVYSQENYKKLAFYFEKLFKGESVSFEWSFNGNEYIFLGKPCVEKDGAIPVAILLTQNITFQKIQAAKLERTLSELESKNFELDSFVYRTSHDLRAPLASILGLTEIMKHETDLGNLADCTNRIRASVQRLDATIRSILDYSQNDKTEVRKINTSLFGIWRTAVGTLGNMPGAGTIEFLEEGAGDEFMWLDEFRLSIIFGNLVSNAIKYADKAKQKCFIKLTVHHTVNGIQITIADNGIGIPKSLVSKVFDMFFRGNIVSEGSGLGLYIVRQAVEKLNGVIQLDSVEGVGTTFTFTFPLNVR